MLCFLPLPIFFSLSFTLLVYFLKRTQICTADLWDRFGGCCYGEFHDIDSLMMFADYRYVEWRNVHNIFKKTNDWKVHIYIHKVCCHSETIFFDGVSIILVNSFM